MQIFKKKIYANLILIQPLYQGGFALCGVLRVSNADSASFSLHFGTRVISITSKTKKWCQMPMVWMDGSHRVNKWWPKFFLYAESVFELYGMPHKHQSHSSMNRSGAGPRALEATRAIARGLGWKTYEKSLEKTLKYEFGPRTAGLTRGLGHG